MLAGSRSGVVPAPVAVVGVSSNERPVYGRGAAASEALVSVS